MLHLNDVSEDLSRPTRPWSPPLFEWLCFISMVRLHSLCTCVRFLFLCCYKAPATSPWCTCTCNISIGSAGSGSPWMKSVCALSLAAVAKMLFRKVPPIYTSIDDIRGSLSPYTLTNFASLRSEKSYVSVFLTALLRCNSPAKQFTHLKCTI